MKKRLTGVLLVLLMVVSMMPALGAGALAGGATYEEVTALDADGEYILAAVKDDSSVYAIKYDGSGIASAALTVMPSNGDGAAYVETDDTGVVWRYTNSNGYCMNGNNTYLYPGSGGMRAYTSGRAIVYDSDGRLSITASGNKTYYLTCSEGSFNTSDDPAAAAVFRVFKKAAGDPTPEDPITETSVNITPDATNVPEESIQIDPGETIILNVTNSSTRSGYDFTATLSRSGVVELQESTVTIASSSTGQFVVTALADGKVDITIQNNNTSSNRKGIVHVTVGSGGSEEPQAGDTVDITPTTDHPEASIAIEAGHTLTIRVTNGSTRDGYDFTATLSNSGIAEIPSGMGVSSGTGNSSCISLVIILAGSTYQEPSSFCITVIWTEYIMGSRPLFLSIRALNSTSRMISAGDPETETISMDRGVLFLVIENSAFRTSSCSATHSGEQKAVILRKSL